MMKCIEPPLKSQLQRFAALRERRASWSPRCQLGTQADEDDDADMYSDAPKKQAGGAPEPDADGDV